MEPHRWETRVQEVDGIDLLLFIVAVWIAWELHEMRKTLDRLEKALSVKQSA